MPYFEALKELGVSDHVCVEVMSGIMPTLHSYIPTRFDHKLIVDIDLRAIGGSALTDEIEVPKERSNEAMASGILQRMGNASRQSPRKRGS